jgi:2',3'-cyclic-nucleotide 2'-phosphodiesterase (5'-nucleotidase family)
MKLRTLLAACLAAVSLQGQESRPAETRPSTIPFVILHTNDLHGQIRPLPDPAVRGPDAPLRGGFQELVNAIDEERSRVAHSVLVDAGDWFQGTPEGTLSEGRCTVELMNAAGYDFAVLGNHDFDAGQAALVGMLELARFRVFARNLRLEQPRSPFPDTRAFTTHDVAWHVMQLESAPPPIVTVGGLRIAFDGMLPEETPQVVAPGLFAGLAVRGEVECARRIRENLSRPYPKADALVLVNHVGKDRNVVIARDVPGIDVIIGGHNHRDVLENGVVVPSTGTLLAQAAPSTTALGIVTIEIDPAARRIVSKKARLRRIEPDPSLRVPRVAPIIERHERAVADVMDVQVATSERPLAKDHDLEHPSLLGNWITQVMLDRAGAEVAVHNATGVRASIPAGAVRVRDLFQISPFGNKLVVVSLKAIDLRMLCEKTAASPSGGCFFRGVEIHWSRQGDEKPKVVKLVRRGHDLRDDEVLQVVTTDFLATGANNYQAFRNALGRRDVGVTLYDATVEAARAQKALAPPADNPWVRTDPR